MAKSLQAVPICLALELLGLRAANLNFAEYREGNARQNGDNRDHDKQLNERECVDFGGFHEVVGFSR